MFLFVSSVYHNTDSTKFYMFVFVCVRISRRRVCVAFERKKGTPDVKTRESILGSGLHTKMEQSPVTQNCHWDIRDTCILVMPFAFCVCLCARFFRRTVLRGIWTRKIPKHTIIVFSSELCTFSTLPQQSMLCVWFVFRLPLVTSIFICLTPPCSSPRIIRSKRSTPPPPVAFGEIGGV